MDRRVTSSKQALREGQWNWVKNGREQNWVLLQGDDLPYFRSTFFRPWFYRTTSFDSPYTVSKSVYILILGIKTCETHEWPKTINTKKPLRIQHHRAKKNNSYKTKKNFTGFYTEDDPNFAPIWWITNPIPDRRVTPPSRDLTNLNEKLTIQTSPDFRFNNVQHTWSWSIAFAKKKKKFRFSYVN